MSSSIGLNKELFQRVVIEVSRRSVGVKKMSDINDVFFRQSQRAGQKAANGKDDGSEWFRNQ